MKYNLTERQKELARWIVTSVRGLDFGETFYAMDMADGTLHFQSQIGNGIPHRADVGMLLTLQESGLLLVQNPTDSTVACVLKGLIYSAVDNNFTDDSVAAPISTLAQPHPPEIAISLDRLRTKWPDPKKLGFLIMRFTAAKPFARIVQVIQDVAAKHGLSIVRADENQLHDDLWGNVRTYLHGCGFGIAVYERIETEEPNANVGLEVGYLMAMNKPVLLLKDKTLDTIQSDLAGKLYKPFDPHDPEGTIPALLEKWLKDYGIVV